MNGIHEAVTADRPVSDRAISFTGTWTEFLPIALTNLLLTIVTLGIYRFWATARERRYLWSRTRFMDESLEWTGTGKEMFIGFLLAFLALLLFFSAAQMLIMAMLVSFEFGAAFQLAAILYVGTFYLIGVAGFRGLRYRLSRTYWRGIRGGSKESGWAYGAHFVLKMGTAFLSLGLLMPWAMTGLWNQRWSRMSFGQHEFAANATPDGLWRPWLLIYLVPVLGALFVLAGIGGAWVLGGDLFGSIAAAWVAMMFIYIAFLLVSLYYYAAFYRQVAGATTYGGAGLVFTARTSDWLKLILGHGVLVILTFGIGAIFIGYRNWSFAVRHLETTGAVDLEAILQTRTSSPRDAEGLADAFDVGAV